MVLAPTQINLSNAATSASGLLLQLKKVPAGALALDCSSLKDFDSGAIAALLELKRELGRHRPSETLTISNIPENLRRLASLYGVEELLFPS